MGFMPSPPPHRVHKSCPSIVMSRVTGNLEWRFLKLPVASFGYNFRIADHPAPIPRVWIASPNQPGRDTRCLLAQNLVSIRRRAGTADPAEHPCEVLLRLESARYSYIKNPHFRFAQHLLGTPYPLA